MRALWLLGLLGCRGPDAPGAALVENASNAFAACDPDEIGQLARRQRVQLAFAACGSNRFLGASWSPDGRLLAFRLPGGAYVLDGVRKEIVSVPGEAPTAQPAWLSESRLALPLPPLEGAAGSRIATVDLRANTLDVVELALAEPRDLQALGGRLLLTGIGADGARRPWLVGPGGALERALPWLEAPVERLAVGGALVGWTDGEGATVARLESGERLARLEGVRRAVPHPEGRYVALELDGAPISPFDQRPWGDPLEPEAEARAAERQQRWLERLPPQVPRTVTPPELQLLDLQSGARLRLRAFAGEGFTWYPANPDHGSFLLWGVEGKELNANVALAGLLDRVRAREAGLEDPGLEAVAAP